jgi:hypothetical protein
MELGSHYAFAPTQGAKRVFESAPLGDRVCAFVQLAWLNRALPSEHHWLPDKPLPLGIVIF